MKSTDSAEGDGEDELNLTLTLISGSAGAINESIDFGTIPFCANEFRSSGNGSFIKFDSALEIDDVKYYTYGILLPTVCAIGILGNILNLIVLNQPNYSKGTVYIYMRGYSSAALMAIIVAIPFAVRILNHNELGKWTNYYQAFFHTYLELYLGNSCLGIGVLMLIALTMERFIAICHPEKSFTFQGTRKAHLVIISIPICTLLVYSPHLFRSHLFQCLKLLEEEGKDVVDQLVYQKRENQYYLSAIPYKIYTYCIGIVFRLGPTILLAYLNIRIMLAYRRTCANRRRMTGSASGDDKRKFAEESRIMMLLGSTSILFFVCVTPMVLLSIMITQPSLQKSLPFQVFRATANLLEVINYSITFYIYCLFSCEFRNTFLQLFQGKKGLANNTQNNRQNNHLSAKCMSNVKVSQCGQNQLSGCGTTTPLL